MTAPTPTAAPKRPRQPAQPRVAVPVKPAAASAANAVTLVAAAFAANPVLGTVVAAGAAGVAGAVAGGKAISRARRRRNPLGLPGLGRSSRLRKAVAGSVLGRGVAAGNGRSPIGATLKGMAKQPAAPRSHRRAAGVQPPSGGKPRPGGNVASGRGSTARRTAGPIRRAGRTAGRVGIAGAGVGAGLTWRGARTISRKGFKAGRKGWAAAGRFVRATVLGKKPKPIPPGVKKTRPNVASTVTKPTAGQQHRPQTQAPTSTMRGTVMANQPPLQAPAPVGPVYQAARQLHSVAVNTQVKGMMEIRTEAHELPHTIAEVAAAIRARAAACTREPLDPAYAAQLMQIATAVDAVAQAARPLGPAFDALHDKEIRRILQPRTNEPKWDTNANTGRS